MSHSGQFTISCPYQAYCCNRWLPGQGLEMHRHDCLQIFHVLQGDFQADTGDGWQQVEPGDAHILTPGSRHALRSQRGDLHFSLTFRTGLDERGLLPQLRVAFAEPCIRTVAVPAGLPTFFETPPVLFNEIDQLRLSHLFDGYVLNLITGPGQSQADKRRQRLLSFLESKSAEALTVEEIAEEMLMSRSALQRFCRDTFGCGARTLHERIRIENAARLLLHSDTSIGSCALMCGYDNIYAFSRTFKRVKGRSPLSFRHCCKPME